MSDEHHDYRGYAGQVAGGVLRPGDDVVVLPSGAKTKIASIDSFDGPLDAAHPPMSVTLRLEDELDVSRGDTIARAQNQPTVSTALEATVCWMSDTPLEPGSRYVVKHTSRSVRATVADLRYRIDVNSLHREQDAAALELNDIGRVTLRLSEPLSFDTYTRNREMGALILID